MGLIDQQKAIDALWKALFEYEDKTEEQFLESDELDISDWMQHRIFVQNMSDIDRQTILNLPSAEPDIICCEDCRYAEEGKPINDGRYWCKLHSSFMYYCSDAERKDES